MVRKVWKKETTVILPGLGNAGGRWCTKCKLEAHHRLVPAHIVHIWYSLQCINLYIYRSNCTHIAYCCIGPKMQLCTKCKLEAYHSLVYEFTLQHIAYCICICVCLCIYMQKSRCKQALGDHIMPHEILQIEYCICICAVFVYLCCMQ